MNFRSFTMTMGLFALLFVVSAVGSLAVVQQCSGQSGPITISREVLVKELELRKFVVLAGDLSSCAGNSLCLKYAKEVRKGYCAVDACNGTDQSKDPTACYPESFANYTIKAKEQAVTAFCSWIKSPGIETKESLMTHLPPGSDEGDWVESVAKALALKGSAVSCENFIKANVGEYGPKWNYKWYRALSGCRIIAHERTRKEEEKDFYTWFGVVRGLGQCSDIVNSEMRNACSAPGAASPLPTYNG